MTTLKDQLQKLKTKNRPDTGDAWGREVERILDGIIDVIGGLSADVLESRPVDGGDEKTMTRPGGAAAREDAGVDSAVEQDPRDHSPRGESPYESPQAGEVLGVPGAGTPPPDGARLSTVRTVSDEEIAEYDRTGEFPPPLDTPEETEPGDALDGRDPIAMLDDYEQNAPFSSPCLRNIIGIMREERARNAKMVDELRGQVDDQLVAVIRECLDKAGAPPMVRIVDAALTVGAELDSRASRIAELEAELELAGQSVTESYEDELTALREQIASLESQLEEAEKREEERRSGGKNYLSEIVSALEMKGSAHIDTGQFLDGVLGLISERDTLRRERDEARAELSNANQRIEAESAARAEWSAKASRLESNLAEVTRRFEGMRFAFLEFWEDSQNATPDDIRDIFERFPLPTEAPKVGDVVFSHHNGPRGKVLSLRTHLEQDEDEDEDEEIEHHQALVQWPASGGEYVKPAWEEISRLTVDHLWNRSAVLPTEAPAIVWREAPENPPAGWYWVRVYGDDNPCIVDAEQLRDMVTGNTDDEGNCVLECAGPLRITEPKEKES